MTDPVPYDYRVELAQDSDQMDGVTFHDESTFGLQFFPDRGTEVSSANLCAEANQVAGNIRAANTELLHLYETIGILEFLESGDPNDLDEQTRERLTQLLSEIESTKQKLQQEESKQTLRGIHSRYEA